MAIIQEDSTKDELENLDDDDSYFNFINSIKSEVTKANYLFNLNLYLKFCNLTKMSDLLTITDTQKQIIKYIMSLRERKMATGSISEFGVRVNPISCKDWSYYTKCCYKGHHHDNSYNDFSIIHVSFIRLVEYKDSNIENNKWIYIIRNRWMQKIWDSRGPTKYYAE